MKDAHFAVALALALLMALAGAALAEEQPRWERGVEWTPAMGDPRGFAPTEADALDAIIPGQFYVDPPTVHNLGFRWYIEGDASRNAKVEVAYRKQGDAEWREALPMLRVQHEVANMQFGPWRTGNLFAGSVMFLEAGTEYEVRFTMSHPVGAGPPSGVVDATAGAAPQGFEYEKTGTGLAVSVSTREEPPFYEGERVVPVMPKGHEGPVPDGAAENLSAALGRARPGDVLLLLPGVHEGRHNLRTSGEHGRPIVLRGSHEGPAIVRGPADHEVDNLFSLIGISHVHFENLVLRRATYGIRAGTVGSPGASWVVVRGCRIEDVRSGISTRSENSEHWHIADNVIVGRNISWYPRSEEGVRSYMRPSGNGVDLYGRGHVVAHNKITRFGDALNISNVNLHSHFPDPDPGTHCVNIDFHHNDLSWAYDDIIETDYGCHNIRVYRNRGYHAHSGISMQPIYGGPVYLIRNEMFAVRRAYKLYNYPVGVVAYHNTTVSQRAGHWSTWRQHKVVFRNNIFMGGDGSLFAMRTGSVSPHTSLDYNAYNRNPVGDNFVRWFDGEEARYYPSLEEFAEGDGHERHGIEVDYDIFQRAWRQREYETLHGPEAFDLRLRPGTPPVDAGVRLPNVNDDYAGEAPDIGAHELGQPLPHYGPRPERRPMW